MADTVREKIIAAFVTRCDSLSSNPVERCRRSRPSSKEPFVSVWDGPSTASGLQMVGMRSQSMQIGIEAAWIPVDEPSIEANAMMGLIEQTILDADRTFGGLAQRIEWQRSDPGYPTDGSLVTTVHVTFLIEFYTLLDDPYNTSPIDIYSAAKSTVTAQGNVNE